MVEMLAVLSVILILLGTYAANTVRTRSMGDVANLRTQAASLELAMQRMATKGPNVEADWRALSASLADPAPLLDKANTIRNRRLYEFLLASYNGNNPALSRPVPFSSFIKAFQGYTLQFPNEIRIASGVRVRVLDPSDEEVYPEMPDMN